MKLTSKQRAQLRSLAADIPTIMQIGKDGIGENLIKTVGDALEGRELKMCIRDSVWTTALKVSAHADCQAPRLSRQLRCNFFRTYPTLPHLSLIHI